DEWIGARQTRPTGRDRTDLPSDEARAASRAGALVRVSSRSQRPDYPGLPGWTASAELHRSRPDLERASRPLYRGCPCPLPSSARYTRFGPLAWRERLHCFPLSGRIEASRLSKAAWFEAAPVATLPRLQGRPLVATPASVPHRNALRLSEGRALLGILMIGAMLRLAWIGLMPLLPESDFDTFYQMVRI